MAPINTNNSTTASSKENKKKRSVSASSGEAQEVQGAAKRSSHGSSSSFPIDYGFDFVIIDDPKIEEGVKKWKLDYEAAFRRQVAKDIDSRALALLSPLTMEDGATQLHDNSSFIQGISQKGMEIVGDFFEDFCQMGRTIPEKEASTKEHKSTPRKKGEDENYVDNGGATPSFVGEGEDYNLGGAGEERPEKE
ncbi:uncharacterized protein E5676_scaffold16G004230 [Cucumis melo var. makuwa]|uniref:Uncharacterized protein n=2 Tax=Cucumis melo TaxID=3656 RepID=A0A5D3CEI5_CUCMM|nr:uncharacterized protein E6C27_scaffold761G00510 [Cucumis melo var. makuwa]TYK10273.1 uncharacterized protein E5676_scaffold16G004230 [Cucumis melo var. makuwa]